MATTKEIKRRITSISNTKKMTKAMELVAATKMRRAVEMTIASRTYAEYAWHILQSLKKTATENTYELLKDRDGKTNLYVLITSNRGLCGGYNTHIIKKTISQMRKDHTAGMNISCITIGRQGEQALARAGFGKMITASFADLPEHIYLADALSIAQLVLDMFKEQDINKTFVAYTDYQSALVQNPVLRQILPISIEELEHVISSLHKRGEKEVQERTIPDYVYEPAYETLVPLITEKLVKMQIYQMLLESRASEHSARMMAMKNANESAGEMIDELTLEFNKARQAAITNEISEISAGMATVG